MRPLLRPSLRLRRLALGLLLLAGSGPVLADEPHVVRDPYYGEALYQFYQQKYYTAAVHLLTARQRELLPHHDAEAQLLLGGIYLSYGLHDEAERLFTVLLDAQQPPAVHDRAWFYLGKIRYYKGLYAKADEAFAHVGEHLEPALREEFRTLRANLLMARQQYAEAAKSLEPLADDDDAQAWYARFNLGVARVRGGQAAEGRAALEQVGRLRSDDPYLKALRDKANLALAYSLLKSEPARARAYLLRVRLNSPFADKALLGLGWAELELQHVDRALVPWDELASRPPVSLAVFEALLARGYARELLGAYPQAMAAYGEAIERYQNELRALDASRLAVDQGRLWDDLLGQVAGDQMGWFWETELLPDTPEARYLPGLMASNGFHEAIKNLRDLNFLQARLRRWADEMPAYDNMLDLRRETYAAQLDRLTPDETLARIEDIRASRDRYALELAEIDAEGDALALASEKERQLLARLQRIEDRLWRLREHRRIGAYRERYRFFKGLLEYDIRSTYPARRWQVQKALRSLDREFEQTLAAQASLQQARAQAPAGFEGFGQRIDGLRGRIQGLSEGVDAAFAEQRQALQGLADQALNHLRGQLVDYLDRARFSLAHLQDLAAQQTETPEPAEQAGPAAAAGEAP